jgi:hypothetical protein
MCPKRPGIASRARSHNAISNSRTGRGPGHYLNSSTELVGGVIEPRRVIRLTRNAPGPEAAGAVAIRPEAPAAFNLLCGRESFPSRSGRSSYARRYAPTPDAASDCRSIRTWQRPLQEWSRIQRMCLSSRFHPAKPHCPPHGASMDLEPGANLYEGKGANRNVPRSPEGVWLPRVAGCPSVYWSALTPSPFSVARVVPIRRYTRAIRNGA